MGKMLSELFAIHKTWMTGCHEFYKEAASALIFLKALEDNKRQFIGCTKILSGFN